MNIDINQFPAQGDILVRRIAAIPETALHTHTGVAMVAEGEHTGHNHVLDRPDVETFTAEDNRTFYRLVAETPLTHPEHGITMLPPGDYIRVEQLEYTPAAIVRVAD